MKILQNISFKSILIWIEYCRYFVCAAAVAAIAATVAVAVAVVRAKLFNIEFMLMISQVSNSIFGECVYLYMAHLAGLNSIIMIYSVLFRW